MLKKRIFFFLLFLNISNNAVIPPKLSNCANTCFLNSALQLMFQIEPVNDILRQSPEIAILYNEPTIIAYIQLLNQIADNPVQSIFFDCSKESWLKKFTDWAYTLMQRQVCSQQDASEFFNIFLTALEEKTQNEDIKSVITSSLFMDIRSWLICNNKVARIVKDPHKVIALPIEDQSYKAFASLNECLDSYFARENVSYKPDWSDTDLPCTKQFKINDIAEYVPLILKRYRIVGTTYIKLHSSVSIPLKLNLKPYIAQGSPVKESPEYELIGIALQGGTTTGGHFWAEVKNSDDGKWYNCNDSVITIISKPSESITKDGYIFLYKRTKKSKPFSITPTTSVSPLASALSTLTEKLEKLTEALKNKI